MFTKINRPTIVGVGYSTVGRNTGLSLRELGCQAALAAMADAGLQPKDIDGVDIHFFPNQYLGALDIGTSLGLPSLNWMTGSAEGGAWLTSGMHAAAAIASGACHTVISLRVVQRVGAAPMRGVEGGGVSGDQQFNVPFGAGQAAQWAGLFMRRHMIEYGTKEEHYGAFAVAQREFAVQNPDAVFRTPLSLDEYMSSRPICRPCKLLDCDLPIDAGSAIIMTTPERARDLKKTPVYVESMAFGNSFVPTFEVAENMTESSPFLTAKSMWSKTDLRAKDVDVAGLYDGFSFIALQWLEALGFCGLGESGPFVAAGNTKLGGAIPTNTDGGACNVGRRHGANFAIEVTRQIRGECGSRQVQDAKVAVISNSVGPFSGCMLLRGD